MVFLLPVAQDKIDAYQKLANKAGKIWIEHGALAYWETVGDDLKNDGVSFNTCAGVKKGECVVLAWVVYPSREDRDRIMAAVISDPRLNDNSEMPFDCTRMAYAGFRPLAVFTNDQ